MGNAVEVLLLAKDEMSKTLESAKGHAEGLSGMLGGIPPVLAAVAAGAAVVGTGFEVIKGAVDAVSNLANEARTLQMRIGGTAEDASRLTHALEETGTSTD